MFVFLGDDGKWKVEKDPKTDEEALILLDQMGFSEKRKETYLSLRADNWPISTSLAWAADADEGVL